MNCPFCAEEIKESATVCKHCRRDLISVRPLLDALQAHAKRVEALEAGLAAMAQAAPAAPVPAATTVPPAVKPLLAIHRGTAIALATLSVFVVGLFIWATLVQHAIHASLAAGNLPPAAQEFGALRFLTLALIVVPLVFGFLCEHPASRPLVSDVTTALVVTLLAMIAIQFIRWQLLGELLGESPSFVPLGWTSSLAGSPLSPNTWRSLLANAACIFFCFSAGAFLRCLVHTRRSNSSGTVITYATGVSSYLAPKFYKALTPSAIEPKVKMLESIVHSLNSLGSLIAGYAAYVIAHGSL